ncbi:MAG: gas vesicle protein GvpN [Candidatus Thermoplasmatota archaeon]|nr:gas vesicle protein GvpN [Candidatus Thermoplasmatota archaeon]MDI6855282.1 gas vesicle protein GvpN [Candidatus Thermoplasmatota archaeon]
MGYVSIHQRKVRGASVHDTLETKRTEEAIREQEVERPKLDREVVEATYLTPEVENFVETPQVKKIESRIELWLKIGYPVHIIGPTGCGKTTIAMHVASKLGRPVVWLNGDEYVTTTDFIGGYSQVEVESLRDKFIHNVFKNKDILKADWVDNPLTLACKYGYTLVYNEFSRTRPEANNILLSVLEEGILELPTKFGEERYVRVHPDFNMIVTSNSVEYAGVHRPQDALLDRMIGIYMDFYDFDTEVEIVKAHTGIATKEARKVVSVVRKLREKLEEAEKPGTRAGIMIAYGLQGLDGYNKEDFEQLCIDALATKAKGQKDLDKKIKLVKEVVKEIF